MQDTHLCRICLIIADRHLVNMVKENYNGVPYLTIYTETVGRKMISIEKSEARICSSCEIEMLEAYKFRKKCLNADEKVKNVLKYEVGSTNLSQYFVEHVKNQPTDDLNIPGTSKVKKMKLEVDIKERKRKLRCKVCRVVFADFENFQFHKCMFFEPLAINSMTMDRGKMKKSSDESTIVYTKGEYTFNECGENEIKAGHEEPKKYVCDLCGVNYMNRSAFEDHMKSHTEKLNYPCPFCERAYKNNDAMRKHARKHHPNDVHHLPEPGAVFNTNDLLMLKYKFATTKRMQTNNVPKNFVCDLCGRSFTSRTLFTEHMRTHRPLGPPVECNICGKVSKNQKSLTQHINSIHKKKYRDYPCPFCEKIYTHNVNVRRHVHRIHPNLVHLLPPAGTVGNQKLLLILKNEFAAASVAAQFQ